MKNHFLYLGAQAAGWGIVLAVLAAVGFSFKAILIKLAYPYGVGVLPLLALRMLFSLPAFAWVGWRESRQSPPLRPSDWLAVTALGIVGYYGASLFDFIGLQLISAGLERMILFTYPTLTVLIGVIFLRRPWHRKEIVALVVSYAGIGFAVGHDIEVSGQGGTIVQGCAWVLLSALCYAGYLVGSGTMIERMGAARFTALAMLVSTLAVLVHFAATQPFAQLIQPWPVYALAFTMAVFSTVLPVFMQSAAIARIGSARAAMIGSLGPVITIGLGALILHEAFSFMQLIGVVLVICGVRIASRRH